MVIRLTPSIGAEFLALLAKHANKLSTHVSKDYERFNGQALRVEVNVDAVHHTPEQQAFYWTMLNQWGRELGYTGRETEEILHNAILCEAFGVSKTLQFRGHLREVPNRRSSKLSIEDYSLLTDTMLMLKAESEGAARAGGMTI